MKKIIFVTLLTVLRFISFSQIIFYNFQDSPSPIITGDNISSSNISISSGSISYQNGTDDGGSRIGNSGSWNQGDFDLSGKYLEFNIESDCDYKIDFTEFRFRFGRTSTGPTRVTIQISYDGFSTPGTTILDNGVINSENVNSLNQFSITSNLPQEFNGLLTIRIWGHNASGAGNLRFNNFRIFGNIYKLNCPGSEGFNNSQLTASYLDGGFIGEKCVEWTYRHSRNEGGYVIDGKGIMLRRASDSYIEGVFRDGIGTISFDYRKAFTGSDSRRLELIVNGDVLSTTDIFGDFSGEDNIIRNFTHFVDKPGEVVIRIKNVGSATTNRQTVIDNISWTCYENLTLLDQSTDSIYCFNSDNKIYVESNKSNSTYQWYSNISNSNNGGLILDGFIDDTLNLSWSEDSIWYYCVVINGVDTIKSDPILVKFNDISGVDIHNDYFIWGGKTTDFEDLSNWYFLSDNVMIPSNSIPSPESNVIFTESQCVLNYPLFESLIVNDIIINLPNFDLGDMVNLSGGFYNYIDNDFTNTTISFFGDSDFDTIFSVPGVQFGDIVVDKMFGELVLGSDINLSGEIRLESGNLKLNQKVLDLGSTGFISNESFDRRIYCNCPTAQIKSVKFIDVNNDISTNISGLGFYISPELSMGETQIIRRHQIVDLGNGISSIERIYDVTPELNNDNLNAYLRIDYLSSELIGSYDNTLTIYRSVDGVIWQDMGFSYIESSGVDGLGFITYNSWQQFSSITIGESHSSLLPVEYLYFNGNFIDDRVVLNWKTLTEINNDKFEIERSLDGLLFEKIGVVSGGGNSSKELIYFYNDFDVYKSNYYYRLRQVDFDGDYKYSKIIFVGKNQYKDFLVYPNPSTDYINLNGIFDDFYIIDIYGRIIFKKINCNSDIKVDISYLEKGLYYIISGSNVINFIKN